VTAEDGESHRGRRGELLLVGPLGSRALDEELAARGWRCRLVPEPFRAREALEGGEPATALVVAGEDPDGAFAACRALRGGEEPVGPILLLLDESVLGDLELREDLFDDFALSGASLDEIDARLVHLLWRAGRGRPGSVIVYGPLALNLETYQAAVDGRPLDLTYMEYELLRFLAARPGRVFTREVLLSQVWGYEYFGGARTVDVHVRRLRAKLGEEHAHLIETVRSVGYRFGTARWVPPRR
jgi:two-component system alkaline phosphatase synthesis response regulator PhoP